MIKVIYILVLILCLGHVYAIEDTKIMMMKGCVEIDDANYYDASQLLEQSVIQDYDNPKLWRLIFTCAVKLNDYSRARFAAMQLFLINNDVDSWIELHKNAALINDVKLMQLASTGLNYLFPNNINISDNNRNLVDNESHKFFWLLPFTFNQKFTLQGKLATDDELIKLSDIDYRASQSLCARYWNIGEKEKAIEYAYKAYNKLPQKEDNISSLFYILIMTGKVQDAANILKESAAYGYRDVDYAYGYLAYSLGRYRDSADAFRRLRNRDLLNIDFCIHEGGASFAAGDYENACNILRVPTALYKNINLDFIYVSTLMKLNKNEEALRYINDFFYIWGDDRILKLLKIKILLRLNKCSEATDEAILQVDKNPELSGLLYYCGLISVKDNNNANIYKAAKKLIEISSGEPENVVAALRILASLDMLPQARELIGKILSDKSKSASKNYELLHKSSEATMKCGMWNETIVVGNQIIELFPDKVKGYIICGYAFEQLNRINEADEYYKKIEVLMKDKNDARILINYYIKIGSFNDALRIYNIILKDSSDANDVVVKGDLLIGNGDIKGAIKYWKEMTGKINGISGIRIRLRLYNVMLKTNSPDADVIYMKKENDLLSNLYIDWKNNQTSKISDSLKKYKIDFNNDDITKILNLNPVTQEYMTLSK